jgi:hypothetical protein
MGSDAPQQPHSGTPTGQREASAGARDDDYRRAGIVIKTGGIHSMAKTREADACGFRAMAVRDGRIMALAPERESVDDVIGGRHGGDR